MCLSDIVRVWVMGGFCIRVLDVGFFFFSFGGILFYFVLGLGFNEGEVLVVFGVFGGFMFSFFFVERESFGFFLRGSERFRVLEVEVGARVLGVLGVFFIVFI